MSQTPNMEECPYKANGYENRQEYLEALADEYGVDLYMVEVIADTLGEGEDFDGLLSALDGMLSDD